MIEHPRSHRCLAKWMTALMAAGALTGCAGVVIGGMAVGAMVAVDRRSSGAQLEDQNIELKGSSRASDAIASRGHMNIASYNRIVLMTGEVPSDADKAAAEQAMKQVENVRAVVNELGVMEASSMSTRSNDTVITSKVKAAFLDAADLQSNAYKVITERSVVYLMGRVTEREAGRAADVARGVGGVAKVVRVFEILTEAELAKILPPSAQ